MRDALERTPRKGARLATVGLWTAAMGFVLVLLSGVCSRLGLVSPTTGMGIYVAGGVAMVVALVTSGLALVRGGGSKPGATWLALLGALVITLINLNLSRGLGSQIHDISTDTANPPAFIAVAPLRTPDENPVTYTGPPEPPTGIGPLLVTAPSATVFAKALETVTDQGWTVVETSETEGRIEATAESGWVRFKDDVVIRVADIGGQTRVDVRSKSRLGRGDLGANSRRVQAYLQDLRAKLAS